MMSQTRRALFILMLLCLTGCQAWKTPATPPGRMLQETAALEYWRGYNQYSSVIWIEADLDNDSRPDTVLIYREGEDKCMMCAVLNTAQGYVVTESTRAPLENQILQSRDIDERPPVEIMVSGSKNSKFGYAIFRLENNQLIDLFAENMNECC